jgi:hypothetical protein
VDQITLSGAAVDGVFSVKGGTNQGTGTISVLNHGYTTLSPKISRLMSYEATFDIVFAHLTSETVFR